MGFFDDVGDFFKDDLLGFLKGDLFEGIGDIFDFFKVIIEFIIDIIKLIPKIVEIMELVVKMIEMGIDFTEDMVYIMPPFIILYLTSYLIRQYEYIEDLSNII